MPKPGMSDTWLVSELKTSFKDLPKRTHCTLLRLISKHQAGLLLTGQDYAVATKLLLQVQRKRARRLEALNIREASQ